MGKAVKARSYTNDQKINAAVLYAHKGTFCAVARDMGIPRTTLIGWSKQALWDDAVVKARHQISEQILAQNLQIATKAGERVLDSLENGDEKLVWDKDKAEHVIKRVKPSGKDSMVISGIAQDKAARGMGLPTQIHAQAADAQIKAFVEEFREAARSFKEKQVRVVSTQ